MGRQEASETAGRKLRVGVGVVLFVLFLAPSAVANQQNAREVVQQAVQTELVADRNDHSHWIYFEIDQKPGDSVKQWVAETGFGSLQRIVEENGHPLSPEAQRARMETSIQNPQLRAKERKSAQHDDKQAEEMLRLLPNAFIWQITGTRDDQTILHFRPDPNFQAPDWETRVFAAMEGDMVVDNSQHRIVSLKGRLIHDVKFAWGLLGDLKTGGTFNVERREIGPSVWQITQTHVHIEGSALLFKDISQNEDDVKSEFHPLPAQISLNQAEADLMKQGTSRAGNGDSHSQMARSHALQSIRK